MRKWIKYSILACFSFLLLFTGVGHFAKAGSSNQKQFIYDEAQLLTEEERSNLEREASELGEETETAYLVLTLTDTDGKDIIQYVEDFYDENAPGYDQPFGNTAILAIDMEEREIYLAGFKKAEEYLDDSILDYIREDITPDLSDGNYYQAFSTFMQESHDYLLDEPMNDGNSGGGYTGHSDYYVDQSDNSNPQNIFFNWIFQLIVAVVLAGIIVSIMVFQSGGRVTVNGNTYMDNNKSKILNRYDRFTHRTVTKQRKPQNNNSGGGGVSGGGHSHSGSRGSF